MGVLEGTRGAFQNLVRILGTPKENSTNRFMVKLEPSKNSTFLLSEIICKVGFYNGVTRKPPGLILTRKPELHGSE